MEKLRRVINIRNILIIISVITFIAVILPLLLIAQYNYASCDDFSYGIQTFRVWQETHSVWEVLKTAVNVVKDTYRSWQGSFSAIFLMALQPSIWSEQAYAWTTFIMIGCLCISELSLIKVVMIDLCKAEKRISMAIGLIILSMQVFWTPYPVQAFFWYNGSVYYTFYYALSLFLMAVVLKCICSKQKNVWWSMLGVILALFIGGGNLPNGLLMTEILFLTSVLCWRYRKDRLRYILPSVVGLFIPFMINVMSPGNANRQTSSIKTPAIESIVKSVWEGVGLIVQWSTLPILIVLAALLPLLWLTIRKMKCQFRFPLLVSVITIGLFASQLTPVIYAQSNTGPGD